MRRIALLHGSTVTNIGVVLENISSLANTRYRVMLSSVGMVVGSNVPIHDSIWLMYPTEENASPNRFMIVEIAEILLRPSASPDQRGSWASVEKDS